mmetsp:Transcript_24792/g.57778  ORF Transcript_24792/g.57778 Transcript_24792/m.57778 type:complete len:301 (+) Transcript_24792:134-1036(+)
MRNRSRPFPRSRRKRLCTPARPTDPRRRSRRRSSCRHRPSCMPTRRHRSPRVSTRAMHRPRRPRRKRSRRSSPDCFRRPLSPRRNSSNSKNSRHVRIGKQRPRTKRPSQSNKRRRNWRLSNRHTNFSWKNSTRLFANRTTQLPNTQTLNSSNSNRQNNPSSRHNCSQLPILQRMPPSMPSSLRLPLCPTQQWPQRHHPQPFRRQLQHRPLLLPPPPPSLPRQQQSPHRLQVQRRLSCRSWERRAKRRHRPQHLHSFSPNSRRRCTRSGRSNCSWSSSFPPRPNRISRPTTIFPSRASSVS